MLPLRSQAQAVGETTLAGSWGLRDGEGKGEGKERVRGRGRGRGRGGEERWTS